MTSSQTNPMSSTTTTTEGSGTTTNSPNLDTHSDTEDANNSMTMNVNQDMVPLSTSMEVIPTPILPSTTIMTTPTSTTIGSSSDCLTAAQPFISSASTSSSFSSSTTFDATSSDVNTASASKTSTSTSTAVTAAAAAAVAVPVSSIPSSSPSHSLSQHSSFLNPPATISSTPSTPALATTTGNAMTTTTTSTTSTTCTKRTSKVNTKKLTKTHTTSTQRSYIPVPTTFSRLSALPSSTPTLSSFPSPKFNSSSSSCATTLIPSTPSMVESHSTSSTLPFMESSSPSTSKSMDLLYAVQTEDLGLLKSLLLKPNMDVHITDPKKRSLLHIATIRKHRGIVRFLLTHAIVSPNVLDGKQMTPLALCLSQQKWFDPIVCSLLIEHGGTTAPKPLVEVMGWALKHADPLNFKKLLHFWTPLNAHVVHVRAKEGWAPIQIATNLGRTDMVSILLEYGANVNEVGALEWPSLHIAARSGNEAMVKVLLEAHANVHYATKEGRTALHMACEKGHLNVVPFLLEYGAHLNVQDVDGLTPLAYALLQPKLSVLEHLVEWGASLTLRTKSNESLVDLALQNGQVEFACFFRHRGVPASNFSNISSLDFIVDSFNAVSKLSVQEHHTFFMQWLDSHLTTSSTVSSLLSQPHPKDGTLHRLVKHRSNSHPSLDYDPASTSTSMSNLNSFRMHNEKHQSFEKGPASLSYGESKSKLPPRMEPDFIEDSLDDADMSLPSSSSSSTSSSSSSFEKKNDPFEMLSSTPAPSTTITTNTTTNTAVNPATSTSTPSSSTASLNPTSTPLSSLNVDTSDAFETCRKLLLRFHLPSTVLRHLDEAYTLSLIHPDVQPLHTMLQQLILFFQPFVTPFLHLEAEVTQLQRQRMDVAHQLQHLIQAQSKFDDLTHLQDLPSSSSSSSSFVEMMKLEDQWIQQMVQAVMEETQLMHLVNQWMDQCHSLKHSLSTQAKPELDPFLLKQQQVQLVNQKHRIQSSKIQLDTAITELQHHWQSKLTEPWLVYFLNLFRPFQPTMVVEPSPTTSLPASSSSSSSSSSTVSAGTMQSPSSTPSFDATPASMAPTTKPMSIPPTSTKPNPTVLLEHLFAWYSQEKQSIFQTQLTQLDQELAHLEMQANLTQLMHDVLEQTLQHVFDQLHRHLDTFHCLSKQLHQSLPLHYQPLHTRLMNNELACKTYLSSVQTELRQVLMAKNGSLRHRQVAELARLEERAEHWYTILDREEKRLIHLESMIQKAFLLIQPHVDVAQLESIRNDFLNVGLTLRVGVKRIRRLDSSMDSQLDMGSSSPSIMCFTNEEGDQQQSSSSLDFSKRTNFNSKEGTNPTDEKEEQEDDKEEEEEETWPPFKKRKMEPSRSMSSSLLTSYDLSFHWNKDPFSDTFHSSNESSSTASSSPSSPSSIDMESSPPSFWQQLKGWPKTLFSFRRAHASSPSLSETETNGNTNKNADSILPSSSSSVPFFSASSNFLSQSIDSEADDDDEEGEGEVGKEKENHVHTSLCAPLNSSRNMNVETKKRKDASDFFSQTSISFDSKLKGKEDAQGKIERNSKAQSKN